MELRDKFDWVINPDAAPGSFDDKRPSLNLGTKVGDKGRYTDPEFAKREWSHLWRKTWLLAGVENDVAEPGDFFKFDFAHESFIIVRDEGGQIRAHFNVCPHRGSQIAITEFGSVDDFSCPFHAWKFNLNGTIKAVRSPEIFRSEVLCHDLNLTPVRCESVGGLIFITLNPDICPAREWLGEFADHFDMYDLTSMKVIHHKRSEWGANWKIGVEAFMELYHLQTVHPQTQPVMDDYFGQYDMFINGHSRHLLKFAKPAKDYPDQDSVTGSLRVMLEDAGVDPDQFDGTAQDAREAIQKAKRERAERLGLDYSKFSDLQLSDSVGYFAFPNNHLGLHPEAVFIMRFLPHPSNIGRFYYDNIVLYRHVDDPSYRTPRWMGLPDDTDMNPTYRPEIEHIQLGDESALGPVLSQDAELLPFVQNGVRSEGFRGSLLSEHEARLRYFEAELDMYLAGQRP